MSSIKFALQNKSDVPDRFLHITQTDLIVSWPDSYEQFTDIVESAFLHLFPPTRFHFAQPYEFIILVSVGL